MITIIHGDDFVRSRQRVEAMKTAFQGEIIVLDGKSLTETEFIQATQAFSMLAPQKLVVVENFPRFALDKYRIYSHLIIWEGSKIKDLSMLANIQDVQVEEFSTPPIIFKLINSLRPKNGKIAVKLFRECLKTLDLGYVFSMLVWAYRQKKDHQKLAQLLEIDYHYKQGQLPKDLPLALELFLLAI